MSQILGKTYGFWLRRSRRGVWGMCYCGPMGFAVQIPVHQVGGMVMLWHSRGYGLSEVWVTGGSTVYVSQLSAAQVVT